MCQELITLDNSTILSDAFRETVQTTQKGCKEDDSMSRRIRTGRSLFWLCSNYGKHLTHHVLANAMFTFLVGSRQLLFLGLLKYSYGQPKPHLEATNRKQCPQLRKLRHLPSSLKRPHTTTIYNAVPESIYRCHGYGCLHSHSRCIAPAARSNQPQHPRKKDACKHSSSTYRTGIKIRSARCWDAELYLYDRQCLGRARHNRSNW